MAARCSIKSHVFPNATDDHLKFRNSWCLRVLASRGGASAGERAVDPLHRAWIDAKPSRDLTHALSTPGRI